MPCVVRLYTTVNCTLRPTVHKYRADTTAKDKCDYVEKTDGNDAAAGPGSDRRFDITNVPITAVAVSSGFNDAGQFELNFKDERCMPFEGASGIST